MEWLANHWHAAVGLAVGVYEAVVRFIPTVGTYSIVSKIINLLKILSDSLDRKK